jgi:hypothetical protein
MKKLALVVATLLVGAIIFVSCKNNSPKTAAEKFLNGLTHMDYEAAKSVSTADTKKTLDLLASFSSMIPDSVKAEAKKVKIVIKDEKIEGDKATVTYTTSEDDHKMERKLYLVKGGEGEKENKGKWLVSYSKDDSMNGSENSDVVEPAPTETDATTDTAVAPSANEMTPTDSGAATK